MWGCSKAPNEKLLGAGIAISIDAAPDSWYVLRDYLKQQGVKLTFYIEYYQAFTPAQIQMLRDFELDGHEIAHHTTTHKHADDYIAQYGLQRYLNDEIFYSLKWMKQDGFNVNSFAYAHGDLTYQLDVELARYFYSIRKIISPYATKKLADMDQIYHRMAGITYYYAAGIDVRYGHTLSEVLSALELAQKSRTTICLYSHILVDKPRVDDPSYSFILMEDFKKIVEKANALGLKFYTATDMSRKYLTP